MQSIQPKQVGVFLAVSSKGSDQGSMCVVKAEVSACKVSQSERCKRSN